MTAYLTKARDLNNAIQAAVAAKRTTELVRLLKCVREDFQWTLAYSEAVTLKETVASVDAAFPSDDALRSLVAIVTKTLNTIINPFERVAQEWWTEPAQPENPSIALLFEDVTSRFQPLQIHDNWGATHVESNVSESFKTAFLHFRVRANKKYRHPLLPSLDFDIVIPSTSGQGEGKTTLLSSEDAGKHSVQAMLDMLRLDIAERKLVVPYVRNDHRNFESKKTPAQSTPPWRRLLPDWFVAIPSSWIPPVPPPAFGESNTEPTTPSYKQTSYYPIPLLKYTGTGRNILLNIPNPTMVASHIYVPIDTHVSPYGTNVLLAGELSNDRAQLVPDDDRLPLPLTDEQARSLIGRIVQYSIAPLQSASERPKKKVRRSVLTEFVAAVWGYDEPTRMLHCMDPAGFLGTSFVMNVSEPGSHSIAAPSTKDAYGVDTKFAHWIGPVSIPEDKAARMRARENVNNAASAAPVPDIEENPDAQQSLDPALAFRVLEAAVAELNTSDDARVFQVDKSFDVLLVGDVQLSKNGLDFELEVTSLKPGKWHVTEVSDTEVLLAWADPMLAESQSDDDNAVLAHEWELLGRFSIDGGVAGAFLASVFDNGGALYGDGADVDSVALLDTLLDHVLEADQRVFAVPGGAIFSVDDGGYLVEGQRDGEGQLVAVRVR